MHDVNVDDATLEVSSIFHDRKPQDWLAIRYNWRELSHGPSHGYYKTIGPQSTLETLRALSHTCRRLRRLALPLLWAVFQVRTVDELGRLRDVLREAPYIAPLIQQFTFMWTMNGDYRRCDPYSAEHGSLLDMAFIDRGALWEQTRKQHRCKIDFFNYHSTRPIAYFKHNEHIYVEPGEPPVTPWNLPIKDQEYELTHGVLPDLDGMRLIEYQYERTQPGDMPPYLGPNADAQGPDGNRKDARIKSTVDFNACFGEIASKLAPTLEVFRWACPVGPVPMSVLEALKLAPKLRSLHLEMVVYRNTVHAGEIVSMPAVL